MAELYANILEKKLVTSLFANLRDNHPLLGFDPSKKCEHHVKVGRHALEEYVHLRHRIHDHIINKLIQFNNITRSNVITNPLPHHLEGNVNAISIVEESIRDFSSPSSPWKTMLQDLA